ncbi:MAG: putative ABC transport system ATP-binding protein [Bacteroidia bacterium]
MDEINSIRFASVGASFIEDVSGTSMMWNKNLTFLKGKSYLLSGISGSGKTSAMNMMYGNLKPSTGEVFFNNQSLTNIKKATWRDVRKNHLSYLFQGFKLIENLTVFENIVLKASLTRGFNNDRILQFLEELDLIDFAHKKVQILSFGQRQRVAFIRGLCQNYDFVLLDEPFSNLDPHNTELLCELLSRELALQKAGLIMATHHIQPPIEFDYVVAV